MGETSLSKLAELMNVLGVENRLRIIQILMEHSQMCVNALACRLDISQSAVSQHLKILHLSGLVSSKRAGYYIHYSLEREELERVLELLSKLGSGSLDPADLNECNKKGERECASRKTNARNRKT